MRTALERALKSDGPPWIVALLLVAIPLVLTLDLARIPGLFEYGDANFPAHAFPVSTFLPWDEHFDLGFDNVFTSLPRSSYLLLVNVFVTLIRNLSIAQYGLLVAITAFGMSGMYRLARGLGAARIPALCVASIFMFNPWTAARIGQTPLIFAFAATPWLFWSVLRVVYRPAFRALAVASVSAAFVLSSLQIAYLDAIGLGVFLLAWSTNVVRKGDVRGLIGRLALVLVLAVLACAFFLFPAVADALNGSGGSVQNVTNRFSYGLFSSYGAYEDLGNAVRLIGFYYSSLRSAPVFWLQLLWVFPCTILVAAASFVSTKGVRRATATGALVVLVLSLFFVVGSHRLVDIVAPLWSSFPGMRGLIDPDYIVALVVLSAALTLACGPRNSPYRVALGTCALILAVPFLPNNGLFQKTIVPSVYQDMPRLLKDSGRLFWMPDRWVSRYTWSPYLTSGAAALWSSGHPAFGPTTVEITPTGSSSIEQAMLDAFEQQRADDFSWFASKTRTRYTLLAHDIVDDQIARYDPASAKPLDDASGAFLERRTLLQYGDLTLDAENPGADLAQGALWQARYLPDGPFREGHLLAGSRSLSMQEFIAHPKPIGDPRSVALAPLARWSFPITLQANDAIGEVRTRQRITVDPGTIVFDLELPATVQLRSAQLQTAASVVPFIPSQSGRLEATIHAARRGAVVLKIDAATKRDSFRQRLTIEATRWPSGRVELVQTITDRNGPVRVATAPYFSLFQLPDRLPPSLFVASHPVIANADVGLLPILGRFNRGGDVIAPARNADADAWVIRAPGSRSAHIPAGSWRVKYVSPTLDLRGFALIGGKRFALSTFRSGRMMRFHGSASIAPTSVWHEIFIERRWATGECSGLSTHPKGSTIVVAGGMLQGISRGGVPCASASFAFQPGQSEIRIGLGHVGMAARGLVTVAGRAFPLTLSASGKELVGEIDAPAGAASRIYLYIDPGVGEIQYRNITVYTWPPGALVIQAASLQRFADRPINVTGVGLLSERATVPPRDHPEIVIASWSYSRGWKCSVDGAAALHTMADGYANAWILPPSKRESILEVRYAPAMPYLVGMITSTIVLVACAGVLAFTVVQNLILTSLRSTR